MDLETELTSLFFVLLLAATAPILVGLIPVRIPQVVILLFGGVLIGPEMLGLADDSALDLFSQVGLGFLFLLAGYEIDLELIKQPVMKRAASAWLVSVAVSLVVTGILAMLGVVSAFVPIAIGLTTTALGTILPIVKDAGLLEGRLGKPILANGASGEFLPILAIAIFLGTSGEFVAILTLVFFGLIALAVVYVPRRLVPMNVSDIVARGTESTSQATLRWVAALLVGLLLVASSLGLDVILGAFIAGVVLRLSQPRDIELLEHKLDAIGYGFFIPIFFIVSGMGLDVDSIVENPGRLVLFFVLLLVVRGGSVYFMHWNLPRQDRRTLAFFAATALPLLVALAEIGMDSGHMQPANAAALVGAGALSVLVFPLLAMRGRRTSDAAGQGSATDDVTPPHAGTERTG
ncbi:MAG TPA: cation:proton antiporter [Actinomycetes bacterium]|nr:cation:proton antiporter [Actinomycetes bacterium]